jgi:NAD(P)-dependent dehydrogenase (short-subunit alcohol dehydrogenase family)
VQDESAVNAALNEVRRTFGPIEGLIHGAGVLADSRIADKTPEQAARVLATKLGGLAALLSATAHDPLRLLCLFSSASAAFGNAGQADYAMANAVLDSVAAAESARRPDAVVKAIAWGPWDGGMVTPTLKAAFAARGIETIGLDAGAAFFVREIALREPAHVVAGTSRLDSDAPSEPATVEPPRQTLLAGQ